MLILNQNDRYKEWNSYGWTSDSRLLTSDNLN